MVLFLDSAEMRVRDRKDLTLKYWKDTVDQLLSFQGKRLLTGAGGVSVDEMEAHVRSVYEEFDKKRRQIEAKKADNEDDRYLDDLGLLLKK